MLTFTLLEGDCRAAMAAMPEASVDAIVTDPPYGIGFMGKEWDTFRPEVVATEKLRDTRGQKRRNLYAGKESDAPSAAMAAGRYDFTGSANQKFQAWVECWAREALRVLKPGGQLHCFGGTRTFHRMTCGLEDAGFEIRDCLSWLFGSGFPKSLDVSKAIDKANGDERLAAGKNPRASQQTAKRNTTALGDFSGSPPFVTSAASAASAAWAGWGTALKPAWEPCILARKPLVGTVAANVQAHGTGALNVDACRIGDDDTMHEPGECVGRWPANVLLDEEAAAELDASTPDAGGGFAFEPIGDRPKSVDNAPGKYLNRVAGFGDSGGASRFFYTAKASRSEREEGLAPTQKASHPTVKPIDLMSWLCRLVTRPGGVILDPFMGSGSTGVAAIAGGWNFIGCEIEPEYLAIARARIASTAPLLARESTVQADGSVPPEGK